VAEKRLADQAVLAAELEVDVAERTWPEVRAEAVNSSTLPVAVLDETATRSFAVVGLKVVPPLDQ